MFGSLQEFIPHYFDIKNNQCFTNQPTITNSPRLSQESSVARKNKILWEESTSKIIDANVIQFANHSKKIEDLKVSLQNLSKSKAKLKIQPIFKEPVQSEKPKNKVQSKEHIPSDKSALLQNYNRLKNSSQIQQKQLLELKRIQRQMQNSTDNSQKKSSFLHLKTKLKHNHQLLKSIVRVEQQEMVSQKTAFQISLESMSNRFKKVKLQNKLRNIDGIGKDIKTMRFALFLNKKQLQLKSHQSSLQKSKQRITKSQQKNPRLRLVQDNIKKWANSRLKSQESFKEKEDLHTGGKSVEMRQNQQNRKKIMTNISKLVNPKNKYTSPRRYSYSVRKSSYLSNS